MRKATYTDNNGIIISDAVSLSLEKRKPSDAVLLAVVAAAGCAGVIGALLSMFNFGSSFADKILLALISTALISASFMLPKKLRFAPLIFLLVISLITVLKLSDTIAGFKLCVNVVIETTGLVRKGYATFKIPRSENYGTALGQYYISVFLDNFIFILSFLISWVTVKARKFAPLFLITFPLVEIGLAFGIVPSYLFFFMTIAFWISILCINLSGYTYRLREARTKAVKRGTFFSKSKADFKAMGKTAFIVYITSFSLLCVICAFVKLSGYSRSDEINELRYALADSKILSVNDIADIFSSDSPLVHQSKSGELGKLDKLVFRDKTMMRVSLSSLSENNIASMMTSSIYLRGNVYSVYENNTWSMFDSEIYSDAEEVFQKISYDALNPLDMYGENIKNRSSAAKIKVFGVKDKNAPQYVPYGTYSKSGDYTYDTTIKTNIIDNEYSFLFCAAQGFLPFREFSSSYESDIYHASDFYSYDNLNGEDFIRVIDRYGAEPLYLPGLIPKLNPEWLDEYEDFLTNYCYYYPNSQEINKVRDAYADVIARAQEAPTVYSALDIIREAIQSDCVYSLSPGKVPANRELVEYFLLENKKGYCTYFATAAVVLCRMSGIPCRYVEGYVLDNQDYALAQYTGSSMVIDVKDSRAHAWAEVYVSGLGWLPFEFTPGYSDGSNPNDNYQEPIVSSAAPSVTTTGTPRETTSQISSSEPVTTSAPSSVSSSAPTGAAPVTTSVSGKSPGSSESGVPNYVSRTIIILIAILILAVLSMVYLYLREKKIRHRREKLFASPSQYDKTVSAFAYLGKMLDYSEIRRNAYQTYGEFAEAVEEKSKNFSNGEFTNATQIASKAYFSQHEPTPEEAERVVALAQDYAGKLYASSSLFERLYLKYLLNL